nr:MAG TPA: hypothetical protein [Caudoviricetes sp.]
MTLTFLIHFSPNRAIFISYLVFDLYNDFTCNLIKSSSNI